MKKLQCTNCGGTINPETYVCEYCGTRYKNDTPLMYPVVVERMHPGTHTLQCVHKIDREMIERLGLETASKICVEQMTQELADSISPFLTVESEFDPYFGVQKVRGKIRVLDPSFRF